ncbi:lysozyme inhibitor LprI family protein [Corticibacterium sp. UT-5YL-CI-8]|nr:lysozyme inhibitor LprI family protein [Tianweitania sp. UT-5YL-CI-8]
MPIRLVLIAGGLLYCGAASAAECDPKDESQMGMNICAAADYKTADAKLNATYAEIVKRLSDDEDGKKRLQAAQRAWIVYRDAECNFATGNAQEGSIYPMLQDNCLEGETLDRVKQLDVYLHCEEGDMSCPVPAAP